MIKVLIVEDSPIMRKILAKVLADRTLFQVECAEDPYVARKIIKQFHPNVITLDIEMPKMDGITFLRNLMKLHPLPVVMLSTMTQQGAEATVTALELGAVDFIGKPKADADNQNLLDFQSSLIEKVILAANSYSTIKKHREFFSVPLSLIKKPLGAQQVAGKLIAIGASTGGIEAIKQILRHLPNNLPPIVIVQHLPKLFSERFANRLNAGVELKVKEAENGDVLHSGFAYIAAGGRHLQIKSTGEQLVCVLSDQAKVNRHRPSVDVLFDSLSDLNAEKLLLVLLTGMGKDGSQAMKRLADMGAYTIVQDQQSSIVWGMPGSAVALNCVDLQLSLNQISQKLQSHFQ